MRMCAPWHMIGLGSFSGVDSSLLTLGSRDPAPLGWLGSKHLSPLSHLIEPQFYSCFSFIFLWHFGACFSQLHFLCAYLMILSSKVTDTDECWMPSFEQKILSSETRQCLEGKLRAASRLQMGWDPVMRHLTEPSDISISVYLFLFLFFFSHCLIYSLLYL